MKKLKKPQALILTLALLMGLVLGSADFTVQALTADSSGNYAISSADDLIAFASLVNSGQTSANGYLTCNIDMSGRDYTPIGECTYAFSGTLDGKGYTISNLTINDTSIGNVALVNDANGATIKNIHLVNANISTNGYAAAGICAEIIGGTNTISNCSVSGKIYIDRLTGSPCVAGIVGSIDEMDSGVVYITSCSSTATISAKDSSYSTSANIAFAAGILGIGSEYSKVYITNCYNLGNITATTTSFYYEAIAGGIVALAANCTISNCYNAGGISATPGYGGSVYVGAITGADTGENYPSSISNCYYLNSSASAVCGGNFVDATDVSKFTATSFTAAQLASGEATYRMNSALSAAVWGQDLDNGKTVDAYPYFLVDNYSGTGLSTGALVYLVNGSYTNTNSSAASTTTTTTTTTNSTTATTTTTTNSTTATTSVEDTDSNETSEETIEETEEDELEEEEEDEEDDEVDEESVLDEEEDLMEDPTDEDDEDEADENDIDVILEEEESSSGAMSPALIALFVLLGLIVVALIAVGAWYYYHYKKKGEEPQDYSSEAD